LSTLNPEFLGIFQKGLNIFGKTAQGKLAKVYI
jgi:hypothetical protein